MKRVDISESGLSHVGIHTDVLLSMARRVVQDEQPELLTSREKLLINLSWVSDKKMRALNKRYRGKDQTTDVLSFSYLETDEQTAVIEPEFTVGDLIISLDTLKKQAKERGHTLQTEAEVLFIHGLLHVLGYDHELGPKELRRMLKQEQKYLGDNAGLIERSASES